MSDQPIPDKHARCADCGIHQPNATVKGDLVCGRCAMIRIGRPMAEVDKYAPAHDRSRCDLFMGGRQCLLAPDHEGECSWPGTAA
jgi:hypothetical protein